MLFLSPGVITNESDQTSYVQEKSNNVAAIAGGYQWGPVDSPTLITNGEKEFVTKFGIPNNLTYKYVMPLIDFFNYSSSAWVVRQVGPTAKNAFPTAQTPVLIKNDDAYLTATVTGADFVARFPGSAGNGLIVDVCDSANFATWEFANRFSYAPRANEYSIAVIDSSGFWTGEAAIKQSGRLTVSGVATGTSITVFGVPVTVIVGDTAAIVAGKIAATAGIIALFGAVSANGIYVNYTEKLAGLKPNYAPLAATAGISGVNDITTQGSLGGFLEAFELMENSPTARFDDGSMKYFYDAINKSSKYVRAGDKTIALTDKTVTLIGGVDDYTINVSVGFQQLKNTESYDVQFLISPDVTEAEQKLIVQVAETRGNCMAFVAPKLTDVVNNYGNEVAAVKDWRVNRLNTDSTYGFAVDNWGYIYDKYNDLYRWVPATGGTAGVFARTFTDNDPWVSPAGLTRGKYKAYAKMAWTASKEDRDVLYPVGINSIVTFPAEGIVLFGDKTLTQRPTAFGHVNVRWAFIVAKESVASMARYYLFEVNDDFTRAQFVNAAKPFLRNMKNRRAFEDFQIVCNENNNDAEIRLGNKMVVQLMIKPVYSINWIILNLSAVRPDVSFVETTV